METIDKSNNLFKEFYKPYRTFLRKLEAKDSLYVVWAYSENLTYGTKFPADFLVSAEFLNGKNDVYTYLSPWELETLAHHILLYSKSNRVEKVTLKKSKDLANVVNKQKDLGNQIYSVYSNSSNIRLELFRMSHKQFAWQTELVTNRTIARYFKIFSYSEVETIVEKYFGMRTVDLYRIWLVIWSKFKISFELPFPLTSQLEDITNENVEFFIRNLILTSEDISVLNDSTLDINYLYKFNPLRLKPLVINDGSKSIYCPIPNLFAWRCTSGIYYDLIGFNQIDFGTAIGNTFQSYIGEVLKNLYSAKLKVYPEEKYGKPEKRTTDWLVSSDQVVIFLETKAKRLTYEAKSNLNIARENGLNNQLGILTGNILKVYKSIIDYKENKYPQIKNDGSKKLFIFFVTLEKTYLGTISEMLEEKIKNCLQENNMSISIEEVPYFVISADEVEIISQIEDLYSFLNEKFSNKYRHWDMETFLNKYIKDTKILDEHPFFKESVDLIKNNIH